MAKSVNVPELIETSNNATTKGKLPADGTPAKENQVLAPFVLSINELPNLEVILNDNLEKITCCDHTFYIGYFATNIPNGQTAESIYDAYNKEKDKEINKYLESCRMGECIRGYKIDGSPILCCDDIPYERYNSKSFKLLVSLEEYMENADIDFPDNSTVFYGDEEESPYHTDKERLLALLNHLEKNYPRHYTVFKMMKNGNSAEEISATLGLSAENSNVYTVMDETMHLCYKFFGSGVLSAKAIVDYKRRKKATKKI